MPFFVAHKLALSAVLIAAGTLSASAVDKLNFDSLPTITNPSKDLPGVDLDAARRQPAKKDNCSESRYYSLARPDLSESGTITECNYGNLSVRTYQKDNRTGRNNVFPTPEPLIDKGPPPGSGGYAPVQRW